VVSVYGVANHIHTGIIHAVAIKYRGLDHRGSAEASDDVYPDSGSALGPWKEKRVTHRHTPLDD
jgi:hypothetical protein